MKTWLFLLVAILPSPVGATTYYLSKSGNDEDAGTTRESAWKSPGKIFELGVRQQITPGDKFLLKRGDVWGKGYLSAGAFVRLENQAGTEQAPIVIGAYSDGRCPVLSGFGLERKRSHMLVRLDNCQHIQVQDIHLIGGQFTQRFFLMTGSATSYIRILKMKFDNTKENQCEPEAPETSRYWGDGVFFREGSGYHHIDIGNCIFTGIGGFRTDRVNKADAINVSRPLSHVWIHDNEMYHCNEGIDVAGGTDHLIEGNLIVETTEFQGIKLHSQRSHISNVVVRRNVMIGAKSWGLVLQNVSKCKVYNNTISGGGYGAAFIGDAPAGVYKRTFKDNTIQNNIFNGLVGVYGTRPKGNIGSVNRFVNNRYYNPRHRNLVAADIQPHITVENFEDQWLTQPGVHGDTFGDTMFVDVTFRSFEDYGDFRLKPGSPCIDAGSVQGIGVATGSKTVDVGAYDHKRGRRDH